MWMALWKIMMRINGSMSGARARCLPLSVRRSRQRLTTRWPPS